MTVPVLAQFGGFGAAAAARSTRFSVRISAPRCTERPVDSTRAPSPTQARRPADRRQRAGARQFHGRLAGLWSRGCAGRSARSRGGAQEPREQRSDPLRQPQRKPGLGAGDPRGDRRDQAEVHRHDGRLERSLSIRDRVPTAPASPRAPGSKTAAPAPRRDTGAAGEAAATAKPDARTPSSARPNSRRPSRPSRTKGGTATTRTATNSAPTNGPRFTPSASTPRSPL